MSAKVQVGKYYDALQRLIDRGEPISKASVAIEAGSKPGCIKPSRPAYGQLIDKIDEAAKLQQKAHVAVDPVQMLKQEKRDLVQRLNEALERELCLLHEVYTLREKTRQPEKKKVTVMRSIPKSS
ncbi:hypothetical protein JY96_11380 [Aquabacterium sp. NJ1]|uniref:hypothetical protein n=1 Tax=Aquabacterium sp. NJ1 TaxID=1538295 RepID=UPI00052C8099|nr:hypothetical protein [Aquabacterium sp. NJ1]KGM40440.1 hypothetical protein JY96_11380 [Aquabacterium sp. NJ1]